MDVDAMKCSPRLVGRNTEHERSPQEDTGLVEGPDVDIAERLERDFDELSVGMVVPTNRLNSMPFWKTAMLDIGFQSNSRQKIVTGASQSKPVGNNVAA